MMNYRIWFGILELNFLLESSEALGEIDASNELVGGKELMSEQTYWFENSVKGYQCCLVCGSRARNNCDQNTPSIIAIVTCS